MARKKPTKTIHSSPAKRALPRLDANTDFSAIFGTDDQSGAPHDFSALLDNSLSTEQLKMVLREKAAGHIVSAPAAVRRHHSLPPPQAELDLHGMHVREAAARAESFIRSAQRGGLPAVRIITGKGLHSEGEGVLRDITEHLILDLKRQNIVQGMRWEKGLKQKSGAVLVVLATGPR